MCTHTTPLHDRWMERCNPCASLSMALLCVLIGLAVCCVNHKLVLSAEDSSTHYHMRALRSANRVHGRCELCTVGSIATHTCVQQAIHQSQPSVCTHLHVPRCTYMCLHVGAATLPVVTLLFHIYELRSKVIRDDFITYSCKYNEEGE